MKKFTYFIVSTLLLFFSSSINPKMDVNSFYDKNQAIYMIRTNDNTESYGFIQLNKVEIFAKNIIRTGTPLNSFEIKPVVEKIIEIKKSTPHLYRIIYYTILTRYESRILLI